MTAQNLTLFAVGLLTGWIIGKPPAAILIAWMEER